MKPVDYARLAKRAYTDTPTIGREDTAARAIVYGDAVGFPGTDNLACWLADLDIKTVLVEAMGELHAGFWTAFRTIENELMSLEAVNVTLGHSEGAALAILYGAALCIAGRPPKAVYAFEPPRVSMDGTLADLFVAHGVSLFLTQNGEDVVPMVPRIPSAWQHPGQLQKIGKPSFPFPNVDDHMIDRVIEALNG